MIEIKAGIDLDRAIAGVIGLICTQRVLGSDIEFYADPRAGTLAVPRTFKPSTNLNDAFDAAEAAGMFLELQRLSSGWMASTHAMKGKCANGETAALAICAAILLLKSLEA